MAVPQARDDRRQVSRSMPAAPPGSAVVPRSAAHNGRKSMRATRAVAGAAGNRMQINGDTSGREDLTGRLDDIFSRCGERATIEVARLPVACGGGSHPPN
jgi:hypothetical protein